MNRHAEPSQSSPPQRSRPVHLLPYHEANRAVIQFVTVCTDRRQPLLARTEVHQRLREIWSENAVHRVGRYVIMPDHLHFFCAPGTEPPETLEGWIRFWKSALAREFTPPSGKLWQRNFWDTQLRRGESYATKWEYARQNPVRAGLVQTADDWPFQGIICDLAWHSD